MSFQFTAAAERALAKAAAWSSSADGDGLQLPELLLGLLAEAECRAAGMLARRGIDEATVRERWPELTPCEQSNRRRATEFSVDLRSALHAAANRLSEHPQPLELATEHLLLGVLAAGGETSAWLVARGFELERLQEEIDRLAGIEPGPLEFGDDFDREPPARSHLAPQDDAERSEAASREVRDLMPKAAARGDETAIYRILDACANRAREGLRVVEDYLRFVLDDAHLTSLAKSLRHDLAAALAAFPADRLYASRNTPGDVGTAISTAGELTRPDLAAVAAANFKRLQESLRSLEEHAKTLDPHVAGLLERLRYRAYALESAAHITRASRERHANARLYVLIDGGTDETVFVQRAESLVAAGVHVLQLRDKRLDDRTLLKRARLLREATRGNGTLFIMNDRPDLAALSQADGVHVGQEELSVTECRRIVGPDSLVGVSTHSLVQARQAVVDGANYIGVGPTFPSGTKKFAAFTGLELLREVAAEITLPAFAIGGITLDNLPQVLAAGMQRVAVSGAISQATDPAAAATNILAALSRDVIHALRS